ncbi:MAG: hypothetical protein ACYC77_08770 [Coriobacteriia bacterium]
MPLAATHPGWENENLATYLMSRLAFVASPVKIGDDVGTDLFCTLFEEVEGEKARLLVPRNSVAVQVKSSKGRLALAPWQLEYLARLEIPYYIGVIDRPRLCLDLHSARYLPLLLTLRGRHKALRLDLVDSLDGEYSSGDEATGYHLRCPLVTSLTVHDDSAATQEKAMALRNDAAAGLTAIATRLNKEYIYEAPAGIQIFAGKDSATTFRENFLRRLAEALYNFAWLLGDGRTVEREEVDIYLELCGRLEARDTLPQYLQAARAELNRHLQ